MQGKFVFVVMMAGGFFAAASLVAAQNATAPARETPRPQDIDPAVNTSATSPARETPRPQDVEPRVNTSSPSQSPSKSSAASPSEAAPSDTSRAAAGAAAPSDASSSTRASASGARGSRAAGAAGNARNTSGVGNTGNAGTVPGPDAGKPGAKGKALDRLELDTTQITGNRELPKVLYIVPWKRSDLGDLVGKPVNSLLDEVLTPVDRDVFQRENRYYRALTPGAAANDALSTPTPADTRPKTTARRPDPAPANGATAPGSPGPATRPGNGVSTGSGSAAPAPRDEK
jgi:hypothetical protein